MTDANLIKVDVGVHTQGNRPPNVGLVNLVLPRPQNAAPGVGLQLEGNQAEPFCMIAEEPGDVGDLGQSFYRRPLSARRW